MNYLLRCNIYAIDRVSLSYCTYIIYMYIKKYNLNELRAENRFSSPLQGQPRRSVRVGQPFGELWSLASCLPNERAGWAWRAILPSYCGYFEPLKGNEPVEPIASSYAKPRNEADPQKEKARLLAMLETGQQARRELATQRPARPASTNPLTVVCGCCDRRCSSLDTHQR